MRHLIGIAVGIGLSLLCGILYAGSPLGTDNVPGPVHTGCSVTAVYPPYVPNPTPSGHSHHDPWFGTHYPYCHLTLMDHDVGTYVLPSGYANLPNAWDRYDLATSQAAINWQTAENMAIQNQLDAARARDDALQMNATQNRSRQTERHTAKENSHLVRPALLQFLPNQINHQTGKICWPEALQSEVFDAARRGLDQLAAAGQPTSHDPVKSGSSEIRKLIEEVKQQLKKQIREMPPTEYIAAHKFLDGLACELQSQGTQLDLVADSSSDR